MVDRSHTRYRATIPWWRISETTVRTTSEIATMSASVRFNHDAHRSAEQACIWTRSKPAGNSVSGHDLHVDYHMRELLEVGSVRTFVRAPLFRLRQWSLRNLSDLTGPLMSLQIRFTIPHSDIPHPVFRYLSTASRCLILMLLLFCDDICPRVALRFPRELPNLLLETDDICPPHILSSILSCQPFAMSR